MASNLPSDPGAGGVRWLIGLAVVVAVVAAVVSVPRSPPPPVLDLVALTPDGGFRDTLDVPASWRDTTAAERLVRVPLVLGVRNRGRAPARPESLSLSLPARYRLAEEGRELGDPAQAGSPLVTYALATGLEAVEPGRLPTLIPALDTLWLEVDVPAYYCVAMADSVPELVPATPPRPSTLGEVRIFYAFEGGDLAMRQTGTLTVRLDTTLLDLPVPGPSPVYPVVLDSATADPDPGALRLVGRRVARCGEPRDPLELTSTLWLGARGGRVITLAWGGVVRKRLYDLDDDGVIERESWDSDGDGVFESTRRARLPTPAFLIPAEADPDGSGGPGLAPDR